MPEPLSPSAQPITDDPQEERIKLHSRLASAVERLPRFIKAESVKNQLRKHPDGVSEEEMEFTLPSGSLPKSGVVPRAKIQSLVDQNGIKVEQKILSGTGSEGNLAKAARKRYLEAEKAHQSLRNHALTLPKETDHAGLVKAVRETEKARDIA